MSAQKITSLLSEFQLNSKAFDSDNKKEAKELVVNLRGELEKDVFEIGLTNDQLLQLIEICDQLISSSINHRVIERLFHLLLPNEDVKDNVILKLFGLFPCMNTSLKAKCLRWVLIARDMFTYDAISMLQNLYSLFFHYLDYHELRKYLIRLLYTITKTKDVTGFRCARLQFLIDSGVESGQDVSDLLTLGELYQQYLPFNHLKLPSNGPFKSNVQMLSRSVDKKWESEMKAVKSGSSSTGEVTQKENSFKQVKTGNVNSNAQIVSNLNQLKRKKGSRLRLSKKKKTHAVFDNAVTIDSMDMDDRSTVVLLSEMDSVADLGRSLLNNTAQILIPDRCTAVFFDSTFQHWFSLCPDEDRMNRVKNNLPHILNEEFFSIRQSRQRPNETAAQFSDQQTLFDALETFSDFMQETIPELEHFLIRYLETWDGNKHQRSVLTLISRISPRSYESLYSTIIKHLYRIFSTANVVLKSRIISCLTSLLQNWALIDWDNHYSAKKSDRSNTKNMRHVLQTIPGGIDHFKVMFELVCFLDQLLVMALIQENDHPLLHVCAQMLYSTVVVLNAKHQVPFVLPPSPALTYRMLMSSSVVGVASMCKILSEYKRAFEVLRKMIHEAKSQEHPSSIFRSGMGKIKVYNSFILDYCNSLWRNNPLRSNKEASGVKSLLCQPGVLEELDSTCSSEDIKGMQKFLSLTNSLAFYGFAHDFVRRRNKNPGKGADDVGMITGENRFEYVDYLRSEKGCGSVCDFLSSFIKPLHDRKQKRHM